MVTVSWYWFPGEREKNFQCCVDNSTPGEIGIEYQILVLSRAFNIYKGRIGLSRVACSEFILRQITLPVGVFIEGNSI